MRMKHNRNRGLSRKLGNRLGAKRCCKPVPSPCCCKRLPHIDPANNSKCCWKPKHTAKRSKLKPIHKLKRKKLKSISKRTATVVKRKVRNREAPSTEGTQAGGVGWSKPNGSTMTDATAGGMSMDLTAAQLGDTIEVTKTIGSFRYAAPTTANPSQQREFRVYIKVTFPRCLKPKLQKTLYEGLYRAKRSAHAALAPLLAAANVAAIIAAIPGLLPLTRRVFLQCLLTKPRLLSPILRRCVKLEIKTSNRVV
ncbi:hypothetical protein [Paenibacillus sp. YYML68]|uniref:hypothetical protein n=1 Tax=Paenibacillus sp. YYML68 TaxID=2909250 RepID=UPI0024914697|nr:hypothetical protein [Paenibacillus sp. YYML68]